MADQSLAYEGRGSRGAQTPLGLGIGPLPDSLEGEDEAELRILIDRCVYSGIQLSNFGQGALIVGFCFTLFGKRSTLLGNRRLLVGLVGEHQRRHAETSGQDDR